MLKNSRPKTYKLSFSVLRYAIKTQSIRFYPQNDKFLLVFPEQKIIYNKIKKSGNTSIQIFLGEILHGQPNTLSNCQNGILGASSRTLQKHSQFYRFTIFRNPYTRCLSGFMQKVGLGKARYDQYPGFKNPSPTGFSAFISYLENDGLYVNHHWRPQTDLLFWTPDQYDYIGKLENLKNDLHFILSQRGVETNDDIDLGLPHPAEVRLTNKVTHAQEIEDAFYTADLRRRVYALYKRDFIVGGYLRDQ